MQSHLEEGSRLVPLGVTMQVFTRFFELPPSHSPPSTIFLTSIVQVQVAMRLRVEFSVNALHLLPPTQQQWKEKEKWK
jgi:hypothetical protein